jgi:hypothetical protein
VANTVSKSDSVSSETDNSGAPAETQSATNTSPVDTATPAQTNDNQGNVAGQQTTSTKTGFNIKYYIIIATAALMILFTVLIIYKKHHPKIRQYSY